MREVNLDNLAMTIAVITGNAAGLNHLNDGMIEAIEQSEVFRDLTDYSLAQIVSSLNHYAATLRDVQEYLEGGGKLSDAEPSIAQQLRAMTDNVADIHQLSDRPHYSELQVSGQGLNTKAIGLDSPVRDALRDVFGGFDVLE